ncbi:hypothetical protein WJ93_07515 [Burkholderia ubonensis]|nr:hypothetical protein WJ93_07515 [Burkholderia ubonensis]
MSCVCLEQTDVFRDLLHAELQPVSELVAGSSRAYLLQLSAFIQKALEFFECDDEPDTQLSPPLPGQVFAVFRGIVAAQLTEFLLELAR